MPKMRAVQVPHPKARFEIVEREIPEPGPGSVRIKVQACGICLALDPDMVTRIDFVAIPRALDDDVARTFDLTHGAVAARADHDPADLVRVSLGAVGPDRIERLARDFHALKTKEAAGLA